MLNENILKEKEGKKTEREEEKWMATHEASG